MLLPSCGNGNVKALLKITLCKNKKRKRDENKELVCFLCSSFSHLSRYAFVLVKPSVSKALKISKYFLNLLLQF